MLPSNESEADRTLIGSPPHRSSLTNKPTSDTSTFNCNTAASIAFFELLRYILCNFTSILLSEPHLQLRVTRRCFPGIESPKARIERISISVTNMPEPQALPTRFPCWCRAVYSWGGEVCLRWFQSLKISNADEDTVQTRPWIR